MSVENYKYNTKFDSNNSEKPKCYVASPYGFAESTRDWYNEKFLPMLSEHVEVLDPWAVPVDDIVNAPPELRSERWVDLGDYHYETIADKAELVVAGLDQEPPDNGTVAEVAWAAAHNVPIIGYRGDMRTSGEEDMPYNLMIASAIRKSGGIAVASMVELQSEVAKYANNIKKESIIDVRRKFRI